MLSMFCESPFQLLELIFIVGYQSLEQPRRIEVSILLGFCRKLGIALDVILLISYHVSKVGKIIRNQSS